MIKSISFVFILLISIVGFSQEICNNGIDDDFDGLIDLQDEECKCFGLNSQLSNAIPNPDFNSSSCCPTSWWNNLSCLDNWVTQTPPYFNNNSSQSVNYLNSCNNCNIIPSSGWNWPNECTNSSNNGLLLMFFFQWPPQNINQNLFSGSCLNSPLYPGNNYQLFFDAFNGIGNSATNTAFFSIYGSTSCNNIITGDMNCSSPNWNGLDSLALTVPNDSAWHQYSFTFSPTDTIYATAIGQTCSANNLFSRLYIDNLLLYENKHTIQITESGSICNPPYILTSTIDTLGGTWQWYKDSIALVGETDSIINVSTMGAGNFTAVYSMNGTCQSLNFEVIEPDTPMVFQSQVSGPVCVGDSINFDGFSFISSGTIDHFYFDFGNGDSAFTEDPTYTYNSADTYTITFTAESNLGCTTSASQVININAKPEVDFLTANECLYDSANFLSLTFVNNGYIDSLAWDFDDGTVEYDSLTSHLYNAPGNYNIKLFARSDQGCIDSTFQIITINPAPVADYTVSNDCENINIPFNNLSAISTGTIISQEWKFGDNNTSNLVNGNHTYSDHGNLITSLFVTSDSGCVDSTSLAIQIYPEPIAHFTVNSSCFLANFENTSAIVNPDNIATTNWDFGNMNTSAEYDPSHYYAVNGDYLVTLQVTSNNGCTSQFDSTINIFNNFEASFSLSSSSICSGQSVNFTNTSSNAINQNIEYYWETSDGQTFTIENPNIVFKNTGNVIKEIDILLVISTSSGCIDTVNKIAAITILTTPDANFSYTPTELSISSSEVQFSNLSDRADSYSWNFGDNHSSVDFNPSHLYADIAKSYTVTLTAYNADKICSDQESKILIVQDEILFFIPNTFTPDGSGFNEKFSPQFISGIDIYNFRLQIFNRWGEIVFESNDPSIGWNGQYAGDIIKQDVYLWQVDFEETRFDKVHTHSGTVTVLR